MEKALRLPSAVRASWKQITRLEVLKAHNTHMYQQLESST